MLYEGYKYYKVCEGKECKVFWRCEFHKAGCKGREHATSVGEAIDVVQQPSTRSGIKQGRELVSSMMKRAREETVSIHRIYNDPLQEISQDVTMRVLIR